MLAATVILLAATLFAPESQAAAFRTYVSSGGNDINTATNCPRNNPCKTFAAAYTVTNAGGEIVALDTAGFGGLTITTSVTITAIAGEYGLVNVVAGTAGININAGASDVVILRNLQFNGTNAGTNTGVQLSSGRAIVQNCYFTQLETGVNVISSKMDLIDSNLYRNTTAVTATGTGTDTQGSPLVYGPTQVRISGGNININGTAFKMVNPGLRPCPPGFTCPPTNPDNKISIFIRLLGNSTADWSVNLTGNTTVTSGSGTGCADPNFCKNVGAYSGNTNPN